LNTKPSFAQLETWINAMSDAEDTGAAKRRA
jgi:chemotaxis protein MotA